MAERIFATGNMDPTIQRELQAYAHDTLHHHTYRLFLPIPDGERTIQHFYRMQYGINFRRWDGQSYSARDPIRATTTLNLGNTIEAATDRFAHEFVLSLAERSGYQPSGYPLEGYLYRDCTGQFTSDDMTQLRSIERGLPPLDATPAFKAYVKNMRLLGGGTKKKAGAGVGIHVEDSREQR